ncbi:hypothetical protein SAMN02745225_00628 [Ferrithrix thermotolerans DSM 19514]|uniref:Uncharacterized protein n=1 Tax=Ferrithrix thermotolerans DSM 19514 TaxID=1121881 RepID=A0A1M4TI99_9ACTN|nr:hypothetical protein [Ferrithrix thermotolerans]SHE44166.1 hypothetical protein SAMN02745225_00628 [Ferrithrix thermotolerans DSM 19514]
MTRLSIFDKRDLFEVIHPDYPGERLVACRNPRRAKKQSQKRQSLLASTDVELDRLVISIDGESQPLRGKDRIVLGVNRVNDRFKMAKHFEPAIKDDSLTYRRRKDAITAETLLDRIYVLRRYLDDQTLASEEVSPPMSPLQTSSGSFVTLLPIFTSGLFISVARSAFAAMSSYGCSATG